MKIIFLSLIASFVCTIACCQRTDTVYLEANNKTSNLYIVVHPPGRSLKGYMILIPGMFQAPQEVLVQTELPKIAAVQGILTLIPTFSTGIGSFGIDSATQASLSNLLDHAVKKYDLTNKPLFIGGFPMGGTCALKYAELAMKNDFALKPSAVFAVDSPLDFERLYNVSLRELKFATTDAGLAEENTYMIKRMEKEFGGRPGDHGSTYHVLSPYSFNDTTLRAIRSLVHLPIRLYTEPDIQWALKAGMDYSGLNAFDFAALTNDLQRLGSKKISMITTTNKGYRKPGNKRHPHSWSIAEPYGLVKWLLAQK